MEDWDWIWKSGDRYFRSLSWFSLCCVVLCCVVLLNLILSFQIALSGIRSFASRRCGGVVLFSRLPFRSCIVASD